MFEDRQERLYRDGYRSARLGCIAAGLDRRTVSLSAVPRNPRVDEKGRADRGRIVVVIE
jgi:hypothetical protein